MSLVESNILLYTLQQESNQSNNYYLRTFKSHIDMINANGEKSRYHPNLIEQDLYN